MVCQHFLTCRYQIDVTREGNAVRVSVVQRRVHNQETRDLDERAEIVVGERDVHGDLVLDAGGAGAASSRLHVGHTDAQLAAELGLATHRFNGALGELVVDGTLVPLWSFAASYGECDGAPGVASTASVGHMFRYVDITSTGLGSSVSLETVLLRSNCRVSNATRN